MRVHLQWIVGCLALCMTTTVVAQASMSPKPQTMPNGCGSGWSRWLVPNSLPLLKCKFESSCNAHDICYGQCEGRQDDPKHPECAYLACKPGGALYGSSKCETDIDMVDNLANAASRRKRCDVTLADNIRKANTDRPVCQAFAKVYKLAVQRFGWDPFIGIDPTSARAGQSQEDFDNELRKFFLNGTDQQFNRFVQATESSGASVDFSKPIKFDSGVGLVNTKR